MQWQPLLACLFCSWTKQRLERPHAAMWQRSRVGPSAFRLFTAMAGSSNGSIAVVGGGLAGLSVTYHLLLQGRHDVTIWDVAPEPGVGGASAVAGGYVRNVIQPFVSMINSKYLLLLMECVSFDMLMTTICISPRSMRHVLMLFQQESLSDSMLTMHNFLCFRLLHPLSPNGKLAHWGLPGLAATNQILQHIESQTNSSSVVLSPELFRVALDDRQAGLLQETARRLPDYCKWLDASALSSLPHFDSLQAPKGALRLSHGCQVLHVPSYLQALWNLCRGLGSVQWKTAQDPSKLSELLQSYDSIVLCAGSGLFVTEAVGRVDEPTGEAPNSLLPLSLFPVQLVRGQSLECQFQPMPNDILPRVMPMLCGKYLSPLPNGKFVVGATHEYNYTAPLSSQQVSANLLPSIEPLAPWLAPMLRNGSALVDRITTGIRVQSQRSHYGRLPMIGQVPDTPTWPSKNVWIFTGLSSRGLLYHGLYGQLLAQAICAGTDEGLKSVALTNDKAVNLLWWKMSK
jgi:glycine/D-amino acid oxidase-like deaminating enzyme